MGQSTKIQWTDRTWNPVRGCSRVSAGCTSCYAERHAGRFGGPGLPFAGFVKLHQVREERNVIGRDGLFRMQERTTSEARWTGRVELVPSHLAEPLSWRKPQRVFVNSMSDLFHEKLSNEDIGAVFGIMAMCPHLTFQILTKRPERMRDWFRWAEGLGSQVMFRLVKMAGERQGRARPPMASLPREMEHELLSWPLGNVWLGTSVEDQATADERVPILLDTPAALRWVSAEPLLGPVKIHPGHLGCVGHLASTFGNPLINWLVVGGESGPGARPFNLAWAASLLEQCNDAGVPAFMKQLGAKPYRDGKGYVGPIGGAWPIPSDPRKGGDPQDWLPQLRVRQFPTASASNLPAKPEARPGAGGNSEVTPGV